MSKRSTQVGSARSPFPGLRPFMAEDAEVFFGRDREIEDLLERLSAFRFVSVVGVSGCGKSSLVRAGVVPVLCSGIAEGLPGRWRIATIRPGGGPIEALRAELRARFPKFVDSRWPSTSYALLDLLRSALAPDESFLLVLDQFEELFRFRRQSLARDGGNEAALFVNLILNVIAQRELPAFVVLTMRSDFLGDCAQFSGLPEAINMSPYLVPRLTRSQRREVIERPLEALKVEVAPQLVQALLNESTEDPDDLPVLQHALLRTWEQWQKHDDTTLPLTLDHYRETGTIKNAISRHADEAYEEVQQRYGESGGPAVRRIFQRLTERDAEGRENRRPSSIRELSLVADTSIETLSDVINVFRREGRSFLTPYTGDISENTQIDVSHECLLRRWTRLRTDWMPEEEESRRVYLRLATRAEDSAVKVTQPDGSLAARFPYEFNDSLSGVLLKQAIDWWERRRPNEMWAVRYHPDFALAEAYLRTSQSRNAQTLASAWDDAAELMRKINLALDTFDWSGVDRFCEELIKRIETANEPVPAPTARQILTSLRRKRRFANMQAVADSMIRKGEDRAEVLRFYAQALLEQGKMAAARRVLDSILSSEFASATDKVEARGMLGRIHKQSFVEAKDPGSIAAQTDLRCAISNYYEAYHADPENNLWPGVNVVALLARADRDGIAVKEFPDFKEMARDMAAVLKHRDDPDAYQTGGIACEIALALGDFDQAYDCLVRYVSRSEIEAFECGSLLRQLAEVWQLTEDKEPGASLLIILRAAILKRSGGSIELTSLGEATPRPDPSTLILSDARFKPFVWLESALVRVKSVARVERKNGRAVGTAFLVAADSFFPEKSGEIILMTCASVIGAGNRHFEHSLRPSEAMIHFTESGRKFEIDEIIWSSDIDDLDVSLLSVKGLDPLLKGFPISDRRVRLTSPLPRLYIVGHPAGGEINMYDGRLLDTDGRRMHYRIPTEGGSAGSAICDADNWLVVGIHHAGGPHMRRLRGQPGTYEANEGITVEAIRASIQKRSAGREQSTPTVFISYRPQSSAAWALLLRDRLEREYGYSVFVDTAQEHAASRFPERTKREIERADVFLCILARGTLDSLWVNHEIELASAAGKPMVPLFLEDFAIPSIEEVPAHVQELLQYQGVRVLDRNNLYVESAIGQLAESIRRTAVS